VTPQPVAPASPFPSPPPADVAVLVVEDDPSLVRALESGLAARGYDVRAVTTGQAALDAAAEHRPDVVLLDLGLPDIDGVDVCRYLRRWLPSPVIVLTADGAEDRKILALDEGADDYVTKPFSMPELLARNAGRVLTHATLLRQVWPERQGDDDTQVLRTHVTVLRKKLGRGDQRPRIVSEPGVGYRLVLGD